MLSPDEQWAAEIRERVLAECHPFQRPAVETLYRFIALLVGRGGGKTRTMLARALLKLTSIRDGRIVYLALTRPHAEELMWEPLKKAVEQLGVMDDFEFSDAKLRARCKRTGATYRLIGMDDTGEVNKLRGQPFDEVQPDECAFYKSKLLDDLLRRAVGPRLGERKGCICLGSSPGHILSGPFYDYTRPGSPLHRTLAQLALPDPPEDQREPDYVTNAAWDGYVSFAWTNKDVFDLPGAGDRAGRDDCLYPALVNLWLEALAVKKRERWSDQNPIWLREYMGKWAADDTDTVFRYRAFTDEGESWNQWDPFGELQLEGIQALRAAIAKLPKDVGDWRFEVSADTGTTDPFACNVFAFSPRDPERRIFHVMPFERTRMYPRQWAQLCIGEDLKAEKPGGIFGEIGGWPDGAVMDADETTIGELANTYGIRFEKADRNPFSKKGAIELVNGDLVDGRIKVIKGSPLEKQLMELQWAEDIHGNVKENKAQANHSTDTLVYGRKQIAKLFETGVVAQESTAAPSYSDPMGLGDEPPPPDEHEDSNLETDLEFVDNWGNG